MHDMNVFRSQFPRGRLRQRAETELRRRKCRKTTTATNARGGTGEQDGAAAALEHVMRRLTADQKSCEAGQLPGLEKQGSGGLQQRFLDVRARVEKTDRDRPDRVFDRRKEILDLGFLPRIDAECMNFEAIRA